MNKGEIIKEIINQVRLESMFNNDILLLSHLEICHGEDRGRLIGEKMQSVLECKQQRFKLENELIQKYGGKED